MILGLLKILIAASVLVALAIILARLVFRAPRPHTRPICNALPPATTGPLARTLVAQQGAQIPGSSGIAPLEDGMEAFVTRMVLAGAATTAIDVQYYIWRDDMTGHLLLKALLRAADRGVRVRILLDDNGIDGLDDVLASMDAHPNIEVRLFNPFMLRRFKRLSYGFDFFRLNHRMHNKAFTVDGRASVLGGRNVGDEYFGTGVNPLQIDLDVLAMGDVVSQISDDFDRYWNAAPVHEASRILRKIKQPDLLASRLDRFEDTPQFSEYRGYLESSELVPKLMQGTLALEWTRAELVSDNPATIFDKVPKKHLFTSRLLDAVGPITRQFDGVTPYFVPGAPGVGALAKLRGDGVKIRMLTNSLEATNMLPVHAGYGKRRKDLLRAGIGLFELRAHAAGPSEDDKLPRLGSSGSNLHAKTFAVDGARIFIGSFNFDPRSATLNTEMGLVIESESMARSLHRAFDHGLGGLAWQVRLDGGKLVWAHPGDPVVTRQEPGTNLANRLALRVVGWLPVEWLL
ncbi:phospholipase D family protein [Gymnodinialimonas sp. 57CJ19]|uniref:phospholipase D family protein n=1 Tax=Gymnodinialimonas sp. 57CJ19 TaxID=3138498 RepID=UPI0031345DAB